MDGPGCRDAHCVIENRIGCVPVYVSGVCCPINYKCRKSYLNYSIACYDVVCKFASFIISVSASELNENKTRIIQIQPEAGKQGVTTLPMSLGRARSDASKVNNDLCLLPKVIGPCKMSKPSFYFDATKAYCFSFLYGGCRVNRRPQFLFVCF